MASRWSFVNLVASLLLAGTITCGHGDSVGVPEDPDPAAITVVRGDGQRGGVGQSLADPFVVKVSDLTGRPVPGKQVTFGLTPGESGTLDPLEATTGEDGHAAAQGQLGTLSGAWEVRAQVATKGGRLLEALFHVVAEPAEADSMFASRGQDQGGLIGQLLADSLIVRVVDRFRNPVPGATVTWHITGGGSVSLAETSTGPDGGAGVTRRLGPTAGAQTAVASASHLRGSPLTFHQLALPGSAATLVTLSGDGQTGEAGRALPTKLAVKVTDASANPIEGLSVSWSVTAGNGSVDPSNSRSNAEGVAVSVWTLGQDLGPAKVKASVPSLSPVVFEATGLTPQPSSIKVTTQPSTTVVSGQWFPVQPVIEVRDGGGELMEGVPVTATIESGGGTLEGTTQVPSQSGAARFTNLAIVGSPGSRKIRFLAGGVSAFSKTISVEPTEQAERGEWSVPFDWPVVGVHLLLLGNGQVLTFGKQGSPRVWSPASGTFTPAPSSTLLFCGGHAFLPDGRLLVTGGHISHDHGLPDANLFDPGSRTWTRIASMAQGRWYPTNTALANGEMVTVGGADENAATATVPEIWDGAGWRRLIGASLDVPYYPWLFQAPNGQVFYAGYRQATRYLDPQGSGSWSFVANSHYGDRIDGAALMYEPGRVMIVGGGGGTTTTVGTRTAEIIDLNRASPAWSNTAPMNFARRHLNATLLPTGDVLVTGGTSGPDFNSAAGTVHEAELWNPATGTWKVLAANSVNRIYHSAAVLLRDGRVLVTGAGERTGDVDQFNAEIYSPPYLFQGTRPRLMSAPATLSYGSSFTIATPDAESIDKVTLLRPGATTHGFDQNQRFMSLAFTSAAGELTVSTPASGNLAPPGDYLLFVVNDDGVPSAGQSVRLR
ncbi:MAG: galactose oxidase-like domain-containing protein [Gemmatimonadales bacterium]